MRFKRIQGNCIIPCLEDSLVESFYLKPTNTKIGIDHLNKYNGIRYKFINKLRRFSVSTINIMRESDIAESPECSYDYGAYKVIEDVATNNIAINYNTLPKGKVNNGVNMSQNALIETEGYNIDGVPGDFVTSFGNYVGLKFFLTGVNETKDVFTYNDRLISENDFNEIKSHFKQCRTLFSNNLTEYEFYDKEFGYILISKDSNILGSYRISICICYNELHEIIAKTGKNIVKTPQAAWVTGVDSDGDLCIKNISIKSIFQYNSKLYPFMNGEDINDFVKKYLESKSSILILIGPPGTSKTNFIRQLLSAANESVLLTYSEDLKKADKLFSHFYDSPEKFLIIEDADTYISARKDGNSNMKQLLNITDGLTANPDKKVIFTTNLPDISSVDPALLRPGRCYTVLQFNPLEGQDLYDAAESIDEYLADKINLNGTYTVAELYAVHNGEAEDTTANVTNTGFGFSK